LAVSFRKVARERGRYSSYAALLSTAPTHIARDTVLEWLGGVSNVVHAHRQEVEWPEGGQPHDLTGFLQPVTLILYWTLARIAFTTEKPVVC